MRLCLIVLTCLVLSLPLSGPLKAGPWLVADLDTGRVIASDNATDPWHPASVTKLMTAYLALKAVKAGKISMNSALTVSEHAASMPPSKVGIKPGTTLTLDAALKILMVKSANDVAVVVAENLSGSVEAFAEEMNREAARLGMFDSRFVNPNGLFAEGQQTSARDMAILGRRLFLDFPRQSSLFGIPAIQLGKRVIENTNGIIGRYQGATGLKTGFICASGFNVVASAQRNGHRLIAVVFGASSGAERTLKTMELLDSGFAAPQTGFQQSLDMLPKSRAPLTDLRGMICGQKEQNENDPPAEVQAGQAPRVIPPPLPPRDKAEPILVHLGGGKPAAPKKPAQKQS